MLLALRGVDGHAENRLDLADLDGVLRALIEQPHNDLIDAVDGVAEAGELELCIRSIHNKKPLCPDGKRFGSTQSAGAPSRGAQNAPRLRKVTVPIRVARGVVVHVAGRRIGPVVPRVNVVNQARRPERWRLAGWPSGVSPLTPRLPAKGWCPPEPGARPPRATPRGASAPGPRLHPPRTSRTTAASPSGAPSAAPSPTTRRVA